ncbi:DUF6633 family protein [Capnocytophaga sp. ARDL2]|uniref:DUF6633 family protein n=1 Tax=Capnocytophaga sp. ARDL2 TaxID=3238809 RepID=UPI003557565A
MKLYDPKTCLVHAHRLSNISVAINAKARSIATIKRDCGETFAYNLLMAWIVCLNEVLGLKRMMSETQVQLCATHILSDYKHLKISELAFLFNQIITGQYGEFYESLSISKLLTFFREYEKQRTETVLQEAERQHNEFRTLEGQSDGDFFKRQIKKLYR